MQVLARGVVRVRAQVVTVTDVLRLVAIPDPDSKEADKWLTW